MARAKFNHLQLIESHQPSHTKSIYPGMIIQFDYKAENIFDKQPMVLVLWNEFENFKVHGINLNYLSKQKLELLFDKLIAGSKTYGKKSKNVFTVEDQDDERDYDDNLPTRNLLKKPYTRLKLPTYKENKGGNPISKAEARVQMDLLYEKVIKKFMSGGQAYQVYRSYKYKNMRRLRVLNMNFERL